MCFTNFAWPLELELIPITEMFDNRKTEDCWIFAFWFIVVGDQCREFDGLYCILTVFLWSADDLIFLKFIIRVIKMNIDTKVNKHNHDQILHQRGCKLMAEVNVCIAEMKSSLSGVL